MSVAEYVYCDFAAGAPCRPEVRAEWAKFAAHEFANPGAHHPLAYLARRKLMEVYERAANVLGVDPRPGLRELQQRIDVGPHLVD